MNTTPAAPIIQFLETCFGDIQRGTIFVSGGRRQADGLIPKWSDTPYDLARIPVDRIAADIARRARWEETFVSAAVFAGLSRTEAQAIMFPSLYSDLDDGMIPPDFPTPTLVIATSPGRRHAYWRLHKPTTRAIAVDLNRRIARVCGGDPSGADATQVLRPPATRNWKYAGVFTGIKSIADRTYDIEDFSHLPTIPHVAPADIEVHGDADGLGAWKASWRYLSPKMRAVATGDDSFYGGDASKGDHALMCALIGCALTPDEAVAAFLVSPRGKQLEARKPGRIAYLTDLSVRKAVSLVGQVVAL